jgi:hypothetical protein
MITEYDVYCSFRRAQSLKNNKAYRLPKDWEAYNAKMNTANAQWLYKLTVYFNTTYSNLNMDEYMNCGFELYPKFTYKNFFDSRVLNLYIEKDKAKKRRTEVAQHEIDDTFANIKEFLDTQPAREGYSQLQSYCKFRDGERRVIINMYMRGLVDTMTLVYCIKKRYLILTDDERPLVPYVSQRYRELVDKLCDVQVYIGRKESELNGN